MKREISKNWKNNFIWIDKVIKNVFVYDLFAEQIRKYLTVILIIVINQIYRQVGNDSFINNQEMFFLLIKKDVNSWHGSC